MSKSQRNFAAIALFVNMGLYAAYSEIASSGLFVCGAVVALCCIVWDVGREAGREEIVREINAKKGN